MISYRRANIDDLKKYFEWTNDPEVRLQSFNSTPVSLEDHTNWFSEKLNDPRSILLIFFDDENPLGQVRFQEETDDAYVVGISIDGKLRKSGYGSELLRQSSGYFHNIYPGKKIHAYIKKENIGSVKSFEKAGYKFSKELLVNGIESVLYIKSNENANS